MRAFFFSRDLWSVSFLASILMVAVYWSDLVGKYAGEPFVLTTGVLIVTTAGAVIVGFAIVGGFERFMLNPEEEETWELNRFFYLTLCLTPLLLGYVAFIESGSLEALVIFSAGSVSAGLTLLSWADRSFAGRTWRKPQKP